MCDSDDLIADDRTPRLKVVDAMADAGEGLCRDCPRHDRKRSWCPVRAEARAGRSPMCRYGRALAAETRKEKTIS